MDSPKSDDGKKTLQLQIRSVEMPSGGQEAANQLLENRTFTNKEKRSLRGLGNVVVTVKPSKKVRKSLPKANIRDGGIETTPDGSARIPISPKPAQKQVLDALFSGPRLIFHLLGKYHEPILTDEDASLFMLKHYKELHPHLYMQRRDDAVNLLRSQIKSWAVSRSKYIELLLPTECSISALHQIYFPIPGLGTISPMDAEAVARLRSHRRYEEGFVLVNKYGKYFVDIAFEKPAFKERNLLNTSVETNTRPAPKQVNKIKQSNINQLKKDRPLLINIDTYLSMFDNSINRMLMQQLHISQQYSRTNFDKLEGWGVNGGLPSLGKHR
jgi:hypothetical protein